MNYMRSPAYMNRLTEQRGLLILKAENSTCLNLN